jgi:large subunit ribosomal protein L1
MHHKGDIMTAKKVEKEKAEKIKKEEKTEEVAPASEELVAEIAEEDKEAIAEATEEETVEVVETEEKEEEVKEHKSVKPNVIKHVHGKRYREVAKLVEKGKEYELDEAIELLKKTVASKFDSSVEIHVNLNVDLENPDHQIRGSVSLPSGSGKEKKVAVVCGPDKEKDAKAAGAETVGGQELIAKIEKGWLGFDVLVATPDMMGALGKIGKILGTKGLMPNPKTGTVTAEVGKIVTEIKKGKADYRVDKGGVIHSAVGKVSFKSEDLKANIETFMDAIHHAKPASAKGSFVKSVFLTTTMGPSVKLSEK